MQIETIKAYYQERGLEWPDSKNALLFYLSEVGELAEACLNSAPTFFTPEEQDLLRAFTDLGLQADAIVSRVPGWLRNNDRQGKANVAFEAGDCQMMLAVFLQNFCDTSPDEALLAKMEEKLGKSPFELKAPEGD